MKKWLKKLVWVILILLILFIGVFYRPDLKKDRVKSLYLTEYSHETELSIQSLSEDILTIEIHYQDIGEVSSPTILLIHGAFSSSHTFIPWALDLVQAGYRVILMDLPYFGLSGGFEDGITSYRRSAEVVNSLLNHLEIESIHIGGNSLGGAVSWFFASEYPTKTKSLILIDAVPPNLTNQRSNSLLSHPILASIVSQFTPRFLLRNILKTAYGDPGLLTADVVDRYYTILRKENTRKFILTVTNEDEPSFGYEDRLKSISVPIFIMWGEKDRWISMDAYEYFVSILDLSDDQYITFPELGHVPMEEAPNTVDYYIDFLNQID